MRKNVSTPEQQRFEKAPRQQLGDDGAATSYRFLKPGVRVAKPTKKKGTERRRDIIEAFIRCVHRTGYFNVTMAEIAAEAEIQPGHLTYYFNGKNEILLCCYASLANIVLEGLERSKEYSGEEKIEQIADFFFTDNHEVNHFNTGLMFEAFGVALYDPALKDVREAMDSQIRKLLAEIIQDLQQGESHTSVEEKAELAYAMLPGLKFTLFFDEAQGLQKGRELFIKTLRGLSGRSSF